jgi:hypothetical protein
VFHLRQIPTPYGADHSPAPASPAMTRESLAKWEERMAAREAAARSDLKPRRDLTQAERVAFADRRAVLERGPDRLTNTPSVRAALARESEVRTYDAAASADYRAAVGL